MRLWQRHVMQGRVWWRWKGSNPLRGPHCSKVFAHFLETLRSIILVAQSEGGSTRRLPGFERRHREFLLSQLSENEQATLRSQSGPLAGAALLATPSHDATRIDPPFCSVCSCCAASICHCPLSLAPAGVAVHSIRLATTAQRAAEQGFWADGGLQLRALAREFAVREAPAFPLTRMCVIWTSWHQRCTMGAA